MHNLVVSPVQACVDVSSCMTAHHTEVVNVLTRHLCQGFCMIVLHLFKYYICGYSVQRGEGTSEGGWIEGVMCARTLVYMLQIL